MNTKELTKQLAGLNLDPDILENSDFMFCQQDKLISKKSRYDREVISNESKGFLYNSKEKENKIQVLQSDDSLMERIQKKFQSAEDDLHEIINKKSTEISCDWKLKKVEQISSD